ncbi:MAG: STAS domain-containing protein [Planctomycetota bacterium]
MTPPQSAESQDKPTFQRLTMASTEAQITLVTFPDGKADGVAVRELYEAVAGMLDDDLPRVVVDFAGVQFLGSGMLGMLVTAMKKLRQAGGRMAVVAEDPMVRQEFQLTHLDRVLDVHETRASAMQRVA